MSIKRIRVENFKSFGALDIGLGQLNILVGANAAGKSNFISIFKFLRDIEDHGLDNAISLQADIEFLRNLRLGASRALVVEIISDQKKGHSIAARRGKALYGIRSYETSYKLVIKFHSRKAGVEAVEDKLNVKCEFFRLGKQKSQIIEKDKIGDGELAIYNTQGKIHYDFALPEKLLLKKEELLPGLLFETMRPPQSLLLESHIFHLPFNVADIFREVAILNINPASSKRAASLSGKKELEEDAGNLALVLKNITRNQEQRRKFSNLLGELLAFVKGLEVEKFAGKSLLMKFRETYAKNKFLPAALVSDGTIGLTALIVALYFENNALTIIEEPERNIHPYLISKVSKMLQEASQKKQIIVTTHNPLMIKYADLRDVLLISRNKEGFSEISKPLEKKEIQVFLENEMGIEDLYVQNLLEI